MGGYYKGTWICDEEVFDQRDVLQQSVLVDFFFFIVEALKVVSDDRSDVGWMFDDFASQGNVQALGQTQAQVNKDLKCYKGA